MSEQCSFLLNLAALESIVCILVRFDVNIEITTLLPVGQSSTEQPRLYSDMLSNYKVDNGNVNSLFSIKSVSQLYFFLIVKVYKLNQKSVTICFFNVYNLCNGQ